MLDYVLAAMDSTAAAATHNAGSGWYQTMLVAAM